MKNLLQILINRNKIGVIGLAEYEWLETLATISPDDLNYQDFVECGNSYAKMLREKENCELIIALTHMRNVKNYSIFTYFPATPTSILSFKPYGLHFIASGFPAC